MIEGKRLKFKPLQINGLALQLDQFFVVLGYFLQFCQFEVSMHTYKGDLMLRHSHWVT
jgi:hypothetical protein